MMHATPPRSSRIADSGLRAVEDESGKPPALNIAGAFSTTVPQGSLIISDQVLRSHLSSILGYSMVEGTGGDGDALARVFRSHGPEVEDTPARLESFARVEYAYLSIFMFPGAAEVWGGPEGVTSG
jgi:hypothetical protein